MWYLRTIWSCSRSGPSNVLRMAKVSFYWPELRRFLRFPARHGHPHNLHPGPFPASPSASKGVPCPDRRDARKEVAQPTQFPSRSTPHRMLTLITCSLFIGCCLCCDCHRLKLAQARVPTQARTNRAVMIKVFPRVLIICVWVPFVMATIMPRWSRILLRRRRYSAHPSHGNCDHDDHCSLGF